MKKKKPSKQSHFGLKILENIMMGGADPATSLPFQSSSVILDGKPLPSISTLGISTTDPRYRHCGGDTSRFTCSGPFLHHCQGFHDLPSDSLKHQNLSPEISSNILQYPPISSNILQYPPISSNILQYPPKAHHDGPSRWTKIHMNGVYLPYRRRAILG